MKHIYLLIFCLIASIHSFAQGIDKPIYQIETHRAGNYLGTVTVELFPLVAPLAVHNFDSLVSAQAYDSTAFHRVVPGFVIQGGDPNSIHGPISTWGQGNASQPNVPAEFSAIRHVRGILGAARDTGINSANSQFYITVAPATFLDGQYTVYGKVTSGMSVVDTIVNSPRDVNDVPLQKIEMFITYIGVNDTIPAAPSLTAPANNAVNITAGQTFTWTGVTDAVLYTAEFSTDSLFSTIDYTKTVGLNNCTFPTMLGSTVYYWRVKANNGGHESAYSPVYKFNSVLAAPLLIYPPDSATSVAVDPIFSWSTVAGATGYTLQVATAVSFTINTLVYNQSNLPGITQQVMGLNPNSLYFWRTRSTNGVAGFYSPKYSFTTGATGIHSIGTAASSFSAEEIFPQPVQDQATVVIHSKKTAKINIEIYDASGKKVRSQEEQVTAGANTTTLDIATFGAGLYTVVMGMENEWIARTMLVK